MLLVKEKIERTGLEFDKAISTQQLNLPFETRQKARFIATLDSGQEVGLQITRGEILRHHDKLVAEDGTVISIIAADEPVSTIRVQDQKLLSRVCYHLGNRHVPLQIESGWCRYLEDHVLDEMVILLGAKVTHEEAPFEPEAGAYSGGHHHSHVKKVEAPVSINDIEGFSAL